MTPDRNSFEELFREEERRFQERQRGEDPIAERLWRSLGFFKLIGQVTEAFIPRVFQLIVAILGGDVEKASEGEAYNRPPSLGEDEDPRDIRPRGPEEEEPPRGPELV